MLTECIESIFKSNYSEIEVILIDNNSSDNSHNHCKSKFPQINLIENNENLGMSARNIGINNANGKFVVFLDSDTVVEKNWLSILLERFRENGDGLYQAKLLDRHDRTIINSAGNMINIFGLGYSRGKGEIDNGTYDIFQEVSYTSGACTFSSKEIFKKIGIVKRCLLVL